MQVREIMSTNVDWIPPDMPIRDASRRMRDEDIGCLPVGENDKLIGMVTDRDFVIRLLADDKDVRSATVRDAMSEKLLYCREDQSIEDVARNMGENQVRRLPVVNSQKQLVGIVSLGDIARRGSERSAGEALGEIAERR